MNDYDKIKIVATTTALQRAFNLQNVHIPDVRAAKYLGAQIGYQVGDEKLYNSELGTPVFADLTLNGGSYKDNITNKTINYPEIKLTAVLLTVDFASRIIKTEIQGRNGTVKEYIGEDDAKVNIQGVITGYNGHYPAYEVGQLNLWRKAPVSKKVVSAFLQNLGIDNLVVESMSVPQIMGGYSYQTFSISCISDLPVELKIQNNA